MSTQSLAQYYRCPEKYLSFDKANSLSTDSGYFLFTRDIFCYGRSSCGYRLPRPTGHLYDTASAVDTNGRLRFPFEVDELVDNLRLERYAADSCPHTQRRGINGILTSGYYFVRPWLGVSVRRHLQRVRLNMRRASFPHWPVDTTVDDLFRKLFSILVERNGPIPFIWFWPDRASGCVLLTHDIETEKGYDFVPALMDLDEGYGIRSSFQVVPEQRYPVSKALIQAIKARGFEVNVHDLNHDGNLFRSEKTFLERAPAIRRYANEFEVLGFRSGAMYRNLPWIDCLGFEYDMSVPNAAQLEAQPGGCCTVMPYFFGHTLELPTTLVQDYSLFHILRRYSIDLWRSQINLILGKHGMASAIVHPDYIVEKAECRVYRQLLEFVVHLRDDKHVWVTRPKDVNDWWRARNAMQLVLKDGRWTIEGQGSDRAHIAFARVQDGQLTYEFA